MAALLEAVFDRRSKSFDADTRRFAEQYAALERSLGKRALVVARKCEGPLVRVAVLAASVERGAPPPAAVTANTLVSWR